MSGKIIELGTPEQRAIEKAKRMRSIRPLLDLENTAAVVRQMKPHDLYAVVKRTGLFDALEVLEVATTDQVIRCMDFDCWRKDRMDLPQLREWFEALMEIGPEKMGQVVSEMEIEAPGLLLHSLADVYEVHEDAEEEPPEDDRPFFRTPDGWYELRPKDPDDEDSWRFVIEWVNNLYAYSMALAQKILLESKWDPALNMEEEAYRWRTIRLNEEGFWDYYEAIGIYQYLDPRKIRVKRPQRPIPLLDRNPNALVEVPEELGTGPFAAAYLRLDDKEQERVMVGVVHLLNRLMAAEQVSVEDDQGQASVRRWALATLNLGTAFLAKHNSVDPTEVLSSLRVERIFQAGHSLTLELRRTAIAMREVGLVSLSPETYTLIEGPWQRFFEAVTGRHPMLDTTIFGEEGTRPFETLEDLARAAAVLDDLSSLRALIFQGFGFDPAVLTEEGVKNLSRAHPGEVSYGDMIRTMYAGFVLTGTIPQAPLPPDVVAGWKRPTREELEQEGERFVEAARNFLEQRGYEPPARLRRILITHLAPLLKAMRPELYILVRTS